MNPHLSEREKELTARYLLANQQLISLWLKNRDWEAMQALAEYMEADAPRSLIGTDPALYRTLRSQITEARLKWSFRLPKLTACLDEAP